MSDTILAAWIIGGCTIIAALIGVLRAQRRAKNRTKASQVTINKSLKIDESIDKTLLHMEGHVQNIGWMTPVGNGEICGIPGRNLRLEAIRFTSRTNVLGLQYMGHLQDVGDTNWVRDGEVLGTTGKARRLEGIAIQCTNPNYKIKYTAYLQNIGWLDRWYEDGEFCGTQGKATQLEAVRVMAYQLD